MCATSPLEFQNNMYRLKLGDVVKFGRISYKVIKLHLPQMK